MTTLFQSLKQEYKVDFFIKCQQLLIKYHPNSSFIVRQNNLSKALDTFYNNINKYQGYCYTDENICVLWNHIYISDPDNVNLAVTENAYKAPHQDFNAISIDFFVARDIKDCMAFVKDNYQTQVKYILFIKGGNPKIYHTDKLIKGITV